ncbi:MAG: hypothetical protein ACQEQI_07090 [Bacillota bacterium]
MNIKVLAMWGLLFGILGWLVLRHPYTDNQQFKDKYSYFFNRQHKKDN